MVGLRKKMAVPMMALAAVTLLGACTTPFEARVKSFQSMPAAQGQTFSIQPVAGEVDFGTLEFSSYAGLVAQELQKQGYSPVASGATSDLTVLMDFGVGQSSERLATRAAMPSMYGWGARGWYRGGWYGRGFGWGGYDPFWGPSWNQPEVYSFAVYPAWLQIQIVQTADKKSVFEGKVESTVRTNDLPAVMPNLVTAMFSEFPGAPSRNKIVRVPQGK